MLQWLISAWWLAEQRLENMDDAVQEDGVYYHHRRVWQALSFLFGLAVAHNLIKTTHPVVLFPEAQLLW